MSDPDWTALAAAILAEVGLTFDDVLDLGRSWEMGPPGFRTVIGEPNFSGYVYTYNRDNPTSRKRPLIALTGPVDCEEMLHVLAHECGHIACNAWTSQPEYEHEYAAELYAFAAFRRHGLEPSPQIVQRAKDYVRAHCEGRYHIMGAEPLAKGWRREIVEWCGFDARLVELGYDPEGLAYR